MRETERRSTSQVVELRAGKDGGLGTLHGYAAKFGVLSQNLGGFVERIAPGAFDKSIADSCRVLCRAHHKDSGLLGTTEAGTLTLTVDDIGLVYDVPLPDTTAGRDCSVLAKRGDLRYSSFAFDCIDDEWGFTEQDFPMRDLLQVMLRDVAPVNSPAYLDATVALRSLSALVHVPAGDLAGKPVEEIRGLILGEKTSAGKPAGDGGMEQRETHSVPPTVQFLQLELGERR